LAQCGRLIPYLREVGRGHLPWLQDPEGAARAIQDFLHNRIGDPTERTPDASQRPGDV
jgi:hypothetical protein